MGFPPDGDTSSTMDFLFTCNKTKSKTISSGGLVPFDFPLVQNAVGTFSWNEEVEDPSECEKRFEEFKEFMSLDNLYFDMLQLGKSISESSSYDEAYKYTKEMLSLYQEKEQYAGNELDLYDQFMGPCRQLGNGALVYGQEIAKINVQFENIVDQRNIALGQFNLFRRYICLGISYYTRI